MVSIEMIAILQAKYLERSDLLNLAMGNSQLYKTLKHELFSHLLINSTLGMQSLIKRINQNQEIGINIKKIMFTGSCIDNIFMGDLDYLLSKCPLLEEFTLQNGLHLSNQLIKSLSFNNPKLKLISIPGCHISDKCIPMLTCFSLLENLDLRMTSISLDLIWSIHTLSMLVSLDLSGAFQGSARDLLNFTSNLKILHLCNSAVSNQELECIADKFPFIEEISLKYCQKISTGSLTALVRKCPMLVSLDVSFCELVDDQFIIFLSLWDKVSLKKIDLSGCNLLTPKPILQMIEKCKCLELIVMNDCQHIIASDIKSYSVKKTHIILNLSSIQNLKSRKDTYPGLCQIDSEFSNLNTDKHLDVLLKQTHYKPKKVQSCHSLRTNMSPLRRRILLADCRKTIISTKNFVLKIEVQQGKHEMLTIQKVDQVYNSKGDNIRDIIDDFCSKFGKMDSSGSLLKLVQQKLF